MVTKVKDRPYFFVIITRIIKLLVEKWRLGKASILENCGIVEMHLRNHLRLRSMTFPLAENHSPQAENHSPLEENHSLHPTSLS